VFKRLASLILAMTMFAATAFSTVSSHLSQPQVETVRIMETKAPNTVSSADNHIDNYIDTSEVPWIVSCERLGGTDRLHTALLAARAGWEQADSVILACSESYADALAGVPLSKALDAPILLTRGTGIEPEVMEEIERLGANEVWLLGGPRTLTYSYDHQCEENGFVYTRLSGDNRSQTAVRIAEQVEKLCGSAERVFLSSAKSFADGLAAGAAAAASDGVILYAEPDGSMDASTVQFIDDAQCNEILVVGGGAAVSSAVFPRLGDITDAKLERIGGLDRYATALKLNRRFDSYAPNDAIVAATGDGFADALAGGALAARLGAPLVLVSNYSALDDTADYIAERTPRNVYILGGAGVISDYTAKLMLSGSINITPPSDPALPEVPEEGQHIARLTFDDGPSANTADILDTLKEEGIKASFFVVYRPQYEHLYRRIVEEGHTLGLHSYTHSYDTIYSSDEAFYNDLDSIAAYVERVTGVVPDIMRFPGGSNCPEGEQRTPGIMARLREGVRTVGYTYYDWNIYPGDASALSVPKDTIVDNLKRQMNGQQDAVVLLHDSPAKTTTAEALPEIIDCLRGEGYTFCAIDEQP